MKNQENGFSLIELMVVVAIIGILASIALPSYTRYVQRGNRVDAKNALLALAQRLEQNYSLAGRYDQTQDAAAVNNAMIGTWGLSTAPSGGTAKYNIAFTSIGQTSFVISATPTGSQSSDTCGVLSLNERNLRAANGQSPNTAGVSRLQATIDCWNR